MNEPDREESGLVSRWGAHLDWALKILCEVHAQ
jgi:hypothetical protein